MEVRMTLSDHMSGRRSLRSVLDSDKHRDSTSRTLMDIIREDHAITRGDLPLSTPTAADGTSSRLFNDRLRLRRTTASSASDGDDLVTGLPTSPVFGPVMEARLQTAVSRQETVVTPAEAAAEEEATAAAAPSPPSEEEQQPVRVSLMALLGQAEDDEEEEEEEEEGVENDDEEDEVAAAAGMYHVCCVCMLRHKGAAFIPCGHTFCRLCSRELWVNRGNCPLCNGYILEILDIF